MCPELNDKLFENIAPGDHVVVALWGQKDALAVVERIEADTFFVRLVGLHVPKPYEFGQRLPVSASNVICW